MDALTLDELKQRLEYFPSTGAFIWRQNKKVSLVGADAGSAATNGYIQIYVGARKYMAHRLAWFYSFGKWPSDMVDHANGHRSDNRLSNLREATRSQNGYNRRRNTATSSGLKGAYRVTNSSLFQSSCVVGGVQYYLGCFSTAEEAAKAYDEFALIHHKQFFNASLNEGVSIVARPKSIILSKDEKKVIVAELKLKIKAAKDEAKIVIAAVKDADKTYALAGKTHIAALKASDKTALAVNKTLTSLEAQLAALTAPAETAAA